MTDSSRDNHGQAALKDALAKAIDRTIAEWDITPIEVVGVLHTLATALIIKVADGTFGQEESDGS